MECLDSEELGRHQESARVRAHCHVAILGTEVFGGKSWYNFRKILNYLARFLETNMKGKIVSDTSYHEDFTSFDDCRALVFAVAEIRPYAAPHGQVAEYWERVLTKLRSHERFPGKKTGVSEEACQRAYWFQRKSSNWTRFSILRRGERDIKPGSLYKAEKNKFKLNEHSVSHIQFSKFNR